MGDHDIAPTMDFSVVIPLFNKAPHVLEAMASALDQSLAPREVIVVDDGSTDGSLEAVRSITDPRVRILTRSPPGPGGYAARNLGIESAAGEWIAFLDADDIWHQHHLADLEDAARRAGGGVGCVFSRFEVREPGRDRLYPMAEQHIVTGRSLTLSDVLQGWLSTGLSPLWTGATAFRRQLLIDVGMFPAGRARRGGDKDTWLRSIAATSCAYAPTPSAEFRLDAVNRVSSVTAHATAPIILETIAALLPKASPIERSLLRRLANQELAQYARHSAGAGSTISANFKRRLYFPEGFIQLGKILCYQFVSRVRQITAPHDRQGSPFNQIKQTGEMSDKQSSELSQSHNRGCVVSWRSLRHVLTADLYRYAGRRGLKAFLRHFIFTPGYRYTVVMRLCGYLKTRPAKAFGLYPISKLYLLHLRYKFGIAIPEYTLIGPGFFINRFGGIYVNGDAVIGANVNYTHGAMLGQLNRGPRAGNPAIGSRVLLASGAKVIGRIVVGCDSSVGANAVVTKDVPDFGVVGGVPAKLLSSSGSTGYINKQVPEVMLQRCLDAFKGPVPENFYKDFFEPN